MSVNRGWFVGLLLILWMVGGRASAESPTTTIDIQDNVWLYNAKRLGLNIGAPDRFGASHLLKNTITNPGFEAGEMATLFLTMPGATATRVQQDNWETQWNNESIGQPSGYWSGAEYEIVTGAAKGTIGTVTDFTHEDGRYTYYLQPMTNRLGGDINLSADTEDLILVRRNLFGYAADFEGYAVADTTTIRPNSPGKQSLRLLPTPSNWQPSFAFYMDTFWRDGDPSSGKLYIVEGNWHFEIWAKGNPGDEIEFVFNRQGETPFASKKFTLSADWQLYSYDFFIPAGSDLLQSANAAGVRAVLETGIRLLNSNDVWIDDVQFFRSDYHNPTAFTDKFVDHLKALRPGIIRGWGGQLGSSLDNQLAEPFARRPSGSQPRQQEAKNYSYSLTEFLALAKEVGAEPWYVIPPTFSAEELTHLIDYLAAPAGTNEWSERRVQSGQIAPWTTVFPTIHLEFGNEMWGSNAGDDAFIGATARGGERLGQFAGDRIAIMRQNPTVPSNINFIIGGQFGYADQQALIESNSSSHDTIALAPYFGILNDYANDQEIFQPLFARPYQDVRYGGMIQSVQSVNSLRQGTNFAIYEINFHTTTGVSPLETRNDFLTSFGGGIALPLYMLSYQKWLGIRNQAAFVATQYSFRMQNQEYARLWGVWRDLEATGIKRPTGLGLELANRAIRGNILVTTHTGDDPKWVQSPINEIKNYIEVPYVQSFAYQEGDRYAIVLFNLNLQEAQNVVLRLPKNPDPQAVQHLFSADSIHDDNESVSTVNIKTTSLTDFAQNYALTLPPHSMQVLEWGNLGSPQQYLEPTATPPPAITPDVTAVSTPSTTPTPPFVPFPTELPQVGGTATATPQFTYPVIPNDDSSEHWRVRISGFLRDHAIVIITVAVAINLILVWIVISALRWKHKWTK